MMFSILPLLSAALILSLSSAEQNSKLLLVQTLFRHGDRSPMFIYPKDPNKADSWPEGLGKLTRLGKKQHYAVGKFLRSLYKDFVTSDPNEVSVMSTATERSLGSAEAHVAGFYAPEESWNFEDELNWLTVPIHALHMEKDKYLSFNSTCPRAQAEYLKLIDSLQKKDHFQKHQTIMEEISNYAGFNISQGINPLWLYDILMVEKIHNFTVPEWANTYSKEIEEIAEITFRSLFDSLTYLRLRVGPLLQKITENMMKKINGETTDLKVQVYSAHNVNVGAALLALNFTHMPRPPYCATLLFELHKMVDETMAVRMLYLNSTDPLRAIGEPHVLVLDDCTEFCPIERYIKNLQHLIPDNWEEECRLHSSSDASVLDENGENVRSAHKTDEL